jgi:hypothetical protein
LVDEAAPVVVDKDLVITPAWVHEVSVNAAAGLVVGDVSVKRVSVDAVVDEVTVDEISMEVAIGVSVERVPVGAGWPRLSI